MNKLLKRDAATELLDTLRSVANKQHNQLIDCVIQILFLYNCRINEVLNARWSDLRGNKFLLLRGSKKSQDIIIQDRVLISQISNLRHSSDIYIFHPLTYYHVYRYVKTNFSHLFLKYKTKKNEKITHGFRYLNAESFNDESSLKALLHHNSTRAQRYYKR